MISANLPHATGTGLDPDQCPARPLNGFYLVVVAAIQPVHVIHGAGGRGRAGGAALADPALPLLSPRELEILAAIGEGLSNKAVARRFGISPHTVKFHVESLFRKLGAVSRADAVAKGLRRQIIDV